MLRSIAARDPSPHRCSPRHDPAGRWPRRRRRAIATIASAVMRSAVQLAHVVRRSPEKDTGCEARRNRTHVDASAEGSDKPTHILESRRVPRFALSDTLSPAPRSAPGRRKQERRESSWRSAARLSPHGLTSPARTATMRRRLPRSASCQKPTPLGVFGYPMVSAPAPTTVTSRCTWTTGHRRCETTEVHVRDGVMPGVQGRTLCTRHARELEACRRRRAARRKAA